MTLGAENVNKLLINHIKIRKDIWFIKKVFNTELDVDRSVCMAAVY